MILERTSEPVQEIEEIPMSTVLTTELQVTRAQVIEWLQGVDYLPGRMYEGFTIVDGIDGNFIHEREVSLVTLTPRGKYPQHVHVKSDARFIVVSGTAILLSGHARREINVNDVIDIPKGTPHGFELTSNDDFVFISMQLPKIKDIHTGEEDFELVDLV